MNTSSTHQPNIRLELELEFELILFYELELGLFIYYASRELEKNKTLLGWDFLARARSMRCMQRRGFVSSVSLSLSLGLKHYRCQRQDV